jgi:hemerythrin-like domain-containing protein
MSKVVEHLERDHVNMAKLMDLVELELEDLESGDEPDYDLLLQILDYMLSYPHLFHHPMEDRIFHKLAQRNRGAAETVEKMLSEHEELERMTKQFTELLESITAGQIVRRDHVEEVAREYVLLNREHMRREEEAVYPLFRKHLHKKDWAQIDAELPGADDPLFGDAVQEPYRGLYERITSGP